MIELFCEVAKVRKWLDFTDSDPFFILPQLTQPRRNMSDDVMDRLKKIIASNVGGEYSDKPMPDNLKLVGNILDSMAVTSLIAALEENFGIAFEDEDLTAEAFESVTSLSQLVFRKLKG
jgi:acyl carrier protein